MNEQTQISVNSDGTGTGVAFAGANVRAQLKTGIRKSMGKGKKKKKEGNPLQMAEEELVNLVSKTKEIYQMVFNARSSAGTTEFFKDLNDQFEQSQKMSDKVSATLQFVKTNSDQIDMPSA